MNVLPQAKLGVFACVLGIMAPTPRASADTVDDYNPVGVTGIFNGNVSTAGSYDPLNHNAHRVVDDIVVPGSIGKYPLKLTRYYNSRGGFGALGPGWRHEYVWSKPANSSAVTYPNGNVWGSSCFNPLGVSDYWQDAPTFTEFRLADGGTVHFNNSLLDYILDPYGKKTTFTYLNGNLDKVTEPGGRYLQFSYGTTDPALENVPLLTKVEAYDGAGHRTDWVIYSYTAISPGNGGIKKKCLTKATYQDTTFATYGYRDDNTTWNNTALKIIPLLETCDDMRYGGAMRQIKYEYYQSSYVTGNHGELYREKNLITGAAVSTIAPQLKSTIDDNVFTETRGDGPTRTFTYTVKPKLKDPGPEPDCPQYVNGPDTGQQFLTSFTDFQGNPTTIEYDTTGSIPKWYVNSVTDALNHETKYDRGPAPPYGIGEITKITHPDTTHIDYTYTSGDPHYVWKITDERFKTTTYTRDTKHRVTKIDYPTEANTPASSEEFTYCDVADSQCNNIFGQLKRHRLKNGAYVHYQYDPRGLLTAKWEPTLNASAVPTDPKTTYTYYTSGWWTDRVQTETFPANVSGEVASETYEYDRNSAGAAVGGRGLVTTITHKDGTFKSFDYDDYGNKLWEENELRQRTSYTYDDYKRVLTANREMGTDPDEKTTYTYKPTNGTGTSSYLHTTSNPDTVKTPTPPGIITAFDYDENFRKISSTTLAATTSFHYDSVGNLDYVTDPRGAAGDPMYTTTTDYDTRNRKWHVTDPQDHTTTFMYDGASNVTRIDHPDLTWETKTYDAVNRVLTHTVPQTSTLNLVTSFLYYPSGTIQKVTDANGHWTTFEYDESDRKKTMTYQTGEYRTWTWDDVGNLESRTTVAGEIQSFGYDNRNRKISMDWSNGVDWADYVYDDAGRLTSASNPTSTVYREYDSAGRLTLDQQDIVGLGAREVHHDYDLDGKPNRLWVTGVSPSYDYTFSYDLMGRFEKITPTGGSLAFQYYYDLASNETQRYNWINGVTQIYTPDNLNRMSQVDVKKGVNLYGREIYGYDAMSRLNSITREDGKTDSFTYYKDGELNTATYGATAPTPTPTPVPTATPAPTATPTPTPIPGTVFTPTFNPDGQYVIGPEFSHQFNVIISTTTTGAQICYTTDGSAPHSNPCNGTVIANGGTATFLVPSLHTTTLKAIGFKSGMTDSAVHSADYTFEHDSGQAPTGGQAPSGGRAPRPGTSDELTVEELLSDEPVAGDGSGTGARSTRSMSADPDGSARSVTYNLDKVGNRNSVVDTGVSTTYWPNTLNQYTGVGVNNNVTNGPEHEVASYQSIDYIYINDEHLNSVTYGNRVYNLGYDALGRCVKRTIRGVTNYYVYDGEKPILEYNSSGTITARNLYGKGIDEILMRVDVTNNWTLYYQQDHEGSVTHLTGTAGTVIEKYRYDAFGAPTIYDANGNVIAATAWNNRFLFTGREYRSTFGFYEYRARAYHPGLGRFMSEDPKLFDAGDYNLFRYCHNDPLDLTDPMGLLGNIWWRHMTPEVYARMMSDATRRAMEKNFSAGAISIGMSGYQEISQRGQSLTVAQTREVQKGSDGRPALDRKVLGETKTATDMSIRAASHDTVPYQVVSYDKDGNQHYTEPARGKDLGLGRYEERSALLPEGAHVRGIGHYHPPGKASFSDKDMRNTVPVMKNRDGHPGLYDLYYRGWRFYFDQNLRPLGAFPYSG